MSGAIRIATAIVVAFAVGALPLILDGCDGSCDTHQDARASTPTCHHATPTTARIARVPTPCRHDHNDAAVAPTKAPSSPVRPLEVVAATVELPAFVASIASSRQALNDGPPRPSRPGAHRSDALRI